MEWVFFPLISPVLTGNRMVVTDEQEGKQVVNPLILQQVNKTPKFLKPIFFFVGLTGADDEQRGSFGRKIWKDGKKRRVRKSSGSPRREEAGSQKNSKIQILF